MSFFTASRSCGEMANSGTRTSLPPASRTGPSRAWRRTSGTSRPRAAGTARSSPALSAFCSASIAVWRSWSSDICSYSTAPWKTAASRLCSEARGEDQLGPEQQREAPCREPARWLSLACGSPKNFADLQAHRLAVDDFHAEEADPAPASSSNAWRSCPWRCDEEGREAAPPPRGRAAAPPPESGRIWVPGGAGHVDLVFSGTQLRLASGPLTRPAAGATPSARRTASTPAEEAWLIGGH